MSRKKSLADKLEGLFSDLSSQSEEHLIVFTLANEHYGVDIAAVESIIRIEPITAVSHAPLFV